MAPKNKPKAARHESEDDAKLRAAKQSASSSSSSADSSSSSLEQTLDALKKKGNDEFTRGHFKEALDFYSAAIDEWRSRNPSSHEQKVNDIKEALRPSSSASSSSSDDYAPPSFDRMSSTTSTSSLSSTSSISSLSSIASTSSIASASPSPSSLSSSSLPVAAVVPLLSNRSATYLALKQFVKALEDADAALELAPHWPKAYLRRGQALEQLLRYHEALRSFSAGLALDSSDATLRKAAEETSALLEELKLGERELSSASSASPDADRFERMVQWLEQHGAQFPKLYLQYYSMEHRGVHALTRVPQDDTVLFVPFSCIMTSQVAMESEIGAKIVASGLDLRSKHSYLASYLLQEREKGAQSFWYPYIQCLPATYANMPIFYPPRTAALLKGSFTVAKIQDRIESLKSEYDHICACVPEFARFTHDEFVWARLVVITRIFGLIIHGQKTDGLVPFADMLNHKKPRDSNDTDTKWTFDNSLNGFTIVSLRAIARGEQVYDSYGRKCGSRFFVNYGFSLEHNEDDNEAMLSFPPAQQMESVLSLKRRMLPMHQQQTALGPREFQVPASYKEQNGEKKSKELFSYLRFLAAVDSDLLILSSLSSGKQQQQQQQGLKIEDIDPISVRNEREVLTMLRQAARGALAEFETSLEEDETLLASDALAPYSNERNCVLQRRGEKQVLRWYLELCDTCIELLDAQWKDIKKRAARAASSNLPLDWYITHVIVPLKKRS